VAAGGSENSATVEYLAPWGWRRLSTSDSEVTSHEALRLAKRSRCGLRSVPRRPLASVRCPVKLRCGPDDEPRPEEAGRWATDRGQRPREGSRHLGKGSGGAVHGLRLDFAEEPQCHVPLVPCRPAERLIVGPREGGNAIKDLVRRPNRNKTAHF
jgi:hypothetical protein